MKRMKKHETPEETIVDEATETVESPVEPEAVEAEEVTAEAAEVEAIDVAALQIAAAKADEYLAMAQRVQADFDNFRRRNESVRAESMAEGQRHVAAAFLPVLDNLERALAASQTSEDESLRTGVDMILKQMNDVYAKLDVTIIDRLGEKFDPNIENAIMQGTPEEGEPGTVCMVLQKGYMMGKTVIRHAMVKVVPD